MKLILAAKTVADGDLNSARELGVGMAAGLVSGVP